jgi:hypothetical protein
MPDTLTDMKVTSREFQRNFARMKALASQGETIRIVSSAEEFIFQAVKVKPRTWQGALKGKAKIVGNIFNTGIEWNASK